MPYSMIEQVPWYHGKPLNHKAERPRVLDEGDYQWSQGIAGELEGEPEQYGMCLPTVILKVKEAELGFQRMSIS
jgi:hypothetical protein